MNLNQITVPSLDVEKTIEFYKQLGLQLIVQALTNYARFLCPEGDASFSIHLVEEPPNDKPWLWREARLRDLDNNQIILFHGGVHRKNPPWRV